MCPTRTPRTLLLVIDPDPTPRSGRAARSADALDHGSEHREENQLELTVLMPCLNEAETVATCVAKARRWMDDNDVTGEVLIAD